MQDSVVQLEIYEEWYWWRGYQSSDYDYSWTPWGLGKTKEPDSYTESTFPSLKPDIDLFGVPRRSRKQRGWHHVAVPFLGRPSERPGKKTHFRALAKPSDIPPELFDNILSHLTRLDYTREEREYWRSTLARCALVCRYWSVTCQPILFASLRLDSREHALQLLKFMRTPISAIPSLVYRVKVGKSQAVTGTPWLHLISVIGDRAHQELVKYEVTLEGPLAAGQRMRSIHFGVPRSLPAHFSRHIERLSLTDIYFVELDDLMHLVWEVPSLEWVRCERVTWGSLPTALPRRRPKNKSESDKSIKMWECGPRPLEASVWLAASVQHRDDAFLSPDDFTRVLSLARELENSASTSVGAYLHSDRFGEYYSAYHSSLTTTYWTRCRPRTEPTCRLLRQPVGLSSIVTAVAHRHHRLQQSKA